MLVKFLKSSVLVIAIVSLYSFDLPSNWYRAGSEPKSYEMGIDIGSAQDGTNAATIKSTKKKIKGFGTLMQSCLAEQYLGKRIKMTGYVKSLDVKGWAGLWLRVDGSGTNRALGFDNMSNRPIKNTTEWRKYEIELDVPKSSQNLAYGALLVGVGQIWFTQVNFEIIGEASAPNEKNCEVCSTILKEPTNLNFSK